MTPSKQLHELNNILDLLLKEDLAIYRNPLQVQKNGAATRITWQPPIRTSGVLTDADECSIDAYMSYLRHTEFSALLFDGALLQLSFDFVGNVVYGHRLCYLPCPWEVDTALLRDEAAADVMELYQRDDRANVRLRPPLRFEYDQPNAKPGHPMTHVHLAGEDVRCAVAGPLCLGQFLRFVFRSFYPTHWDEYEFLRQLECGLGDRTITGDEERDIHFTAVSGAGETD